MSFKLKQKKYYFNLKTNLIFKMLILFELKLRLLKSDNTLFYFLNITPPPQNTHLNKIHVPGYILKIANLLQSSVI